MTKLFDDFIAMLATELTPDNQKTPQALARDQQARAKFQGHVMQEIRHDAGVMWNGAEQEPKA